MKQPTYRRLANAYRQRPCQASIDTEPTWLFGSGNLINTARGLVFDGGGGKSRMPSACRKVFIFVSYDLLKKVTR
jgi:hypothetical protein